MSAALLSASMSKGRVVKDIEQMWCRASKSARGDRKFAATKVATSLQYASAGDSPPTTYTYTYSYRNFCGNGTADS